MDTKRLTPDEEKRNREVVGMRENWGYMMESLRKLQVLTTRVGQQHLQHGQEENVRKLRAALDDGLEEGMRIYSYLVGAKICDPPVPQKTFGYASPDDIPVKEG
jgi:hypothetical protein